jgi:hypothetical protein
MYSLLNYLTSSSSNKDTGNGHAKSMRSGLQQHDDHLETMTVHTTAGGTFVGTRTDEQKMKINASTIAVVTRLAMEFKQSEVRPSSFCLFSRSPASLTSLLTLL